jgi:predicted ATP-grasp superfamily ATP-dependent carboligase
MDHSVPLAAGRPSSGPRAIVLGVEHPRGVAVVRSLGRHRVPVVAIERDPTARGLRSRYLGRRVLVGDSPEQTLAALESLERDGGLLIPTNDHFLMIVSQHFERLSRAFSISVPPWSTLRGLMDKAECYRLGKEAGLRTPRVFLPRDAEELERVLSTLDFTSQRYILSKRLPVADPVDTRTGRFTKAAGLDADAMRATCLDVAARTGELPMISEVVPGRSDRCVGVSMVVNREHVPVVAYCVRRLQLYLYSLDAGFRHPYDLGANVFCESVHDAEAIEAATRFVRQARFYGAITVEFRRDSRDGQLTLIKADPRVVRATALSTALGLDVPTALHAVFTGGQLPVPRPYREGIAWIWLSWYLDTLWTSRGRTSLAGQLRALLRNCHRVRSFAYLSLRDPGPALVDGFRWGRNWLRLGRRAALRAALAAESALGKLARAARRRSGAVAP